MPLPWTLWHPDHPCPSVFPWQHSLSSSHHSKYLTGSTKTASLGGKKWQLLTSFSQIGISAGYQNRDTTSLLGEQWSQKEGLHEKPFLARLVRMKASDSWSSVEKMERLECQRGREITTHAQETAQHHPVVLKACALWWSFLPLSIHSETSPAHSPEVYLASSRVT